MPDTAATDRSARNAAALADIYEAFGRGDRPAILARIADGCAWEAWEDNSNQRAGLEVARPRTGPAGVADFFAFVAELDIHSLELLDILASDRQAVAEVVIELTTPQGRRIRDEELHLWTFDAEGRVTRMRHYVDTAKHIAAYAEG
jgi:ketosteroid isomerase-like protein